MAEPLESDGAMGAGWVTVTGVVGGTESYTVCAPAGPGVGAAPLTIQYTSPVPASEPGVAISVSVPARAPATPTRP